LPQNTKLAKFNGKIDNLIIIVGVLNIPLSIKYRKAKQKTRKS
jgi:hypothetical protein